MSKRSSITCSVQQRSEFRKIKEKLAKIYGKEEYEITDRQVFQHLLDTFNKYQHLCFITIAKEFSNQLENSLQTLKEVTATYEEIEKLKQENEELRKEIEELKEKLKDGLMSATYEELHDRFVRTLSRHLEQMGMKGVKFNDDVYEGLMVLLNMFKTPTGAVKGLELLGRAVRAFNVNYDSV